MKNVTTVLNKELLEVLRDKRMLMVMILPVVLIPVMAMVMVFFQSEAMEEEKNRAITVALIGEHPPLELQLQKSPAIHLEKDYTLQEARQAIGKDEIQGAIALEEHFSKDLNDLKSAGLDLYFKKTNFFAKEKMMAAIAPFREKVLEERLALLNVTKQNINPLNISEVDVSDTREIIGQIGGSMLGYFIILLSLVGCVTVATDVVVGEKERGTLETVLTAPVSKMELLTAKMIIISIVGIFAAMFTFLAMVITLQFVPNIPDYIVETFNEILNGTFVSLMMVMLIPLCVFFAGIAVAIMVNAKSFKEAQSYTGPMMMVFILPMMASFIPTLRLTWVTALIPVLNVSLALKSIISDTMIPALYLLTLVSLLVLAFLAVLLSQKQFAREGSLVN